MLDGTPRRSLAFATGLVMASNLLAQAPGSTAWPIESAGAGCRELTARIAAAGPLTLRDGGLCGVLGGAVVRLGGKAGVATEATVQLPLPQLLAGQVPLRFTLTTEPADALRELEILHHDGANAVLQATVQGARGTEVRFTWASVVLLAERTDPAGPEAEGFLAATPCAEADDAAIQRLASELAPEQATPAVLAKALQPWIAAQPRQQGPTTLDAKALLTSGNHGICTMHANFAAAVLRSRQVPTRQLAVIPTNGMRLEMHRIVAFAADGRWQRFDPSGVHAEVPMRTCDSVVVSSTSIEDERLGGTLRIGAPLGCPYGQELEIVRGQAFPFGPEFFWTQARPLGSFAVDDATLAAARAAWRHFLTRGVIDPAAERAAACRELETFAKAWRE